MKSPQERYHSDPIFRAIVDQLTALIRTAEITPSEVREAAVLACINYEMTRVDLHHLPIEVEDWLQGRREPSTMEDLITEERRSK